MIQVDPRDRGDLGSRCGNSIVAAAEARFEDREFDLLFGEGEKGDGGHLLEERRSVSEFLVGQKRLRDSAYASGQVREFLFRDIHAPDLYSLGNRYQVRRGV